MTLVVTKRPTSSNKCSYKTSRGLSADQMLHQGRLYCITNCIPINLMFEENFPTNTQVWNSLSHRNDCRQRGVIWVIYGWYNTNRYTSSGTSVIRRSSVPPPACLGRLYHRIYSLWLYQLIATRYSCEVKGCNTMPVCGCRTQPLLIKTSMARSLPEENLLRQNMGSIINYLQ